MAEEEVKIESVDQIIALVSDDQRDKVKDSIVNYIGSISQKEFGAEDFKNYANDSVNESIVNSVFDSRVSLAVNKFKDNFMKSKFPELLDAEIKKRYPEKTQAEIASVEMQERINTLENTIKEKDQTNIALSKMDGLPDGIKADYFIGETDEETINNVNKFKEILIAWRDVAVKAKDDEWLEKTASNPKVGQDGEITKSYAESSLTERGEFLKKYGKEKYDSWSNIKK